VSPKRIPTFGDPQRGSCKGFPTRVVTQRRFPSLLRAVPQGWSLRGVSTGVTHLGPPRGGPHRRSPKVVPKTWGPTRVFQKVGAQRRCYYGPLRGVPQVGSIWGVPHVASPKGGPPRWFPQKSSLNGGPQRVIQEGGSRTGGPSMGAPKGVR
jgi:hypothetical protein